MRSGAEASLWDVGLRPVGVDKYGPKWLKKDLERTLAGMINADDYFYRVTKMMTEDARKAIALTNDVEAELSKSLMAFSVTQGKFAEDSRAASGRVRDAADKLAAGLAKVEKAADFNRLERYVDLLERAATAMTTLAALQDQGRLEKIAVALK